ncbi:hypothetical protein BP00DRAFT_414861 [Aspergillus indologenus CBS 114.80]|uniref:Uncharacterized protein n=1 Tax=Aspergillus indologenus CBS 114.80 TaxID=1450541 RepID=A0A2V5I6A2_9EURO|nr:hypothetical protein BP00DRAFT_414861 [Aspergillus indologenus CBS 114.80]
MKFLQLLRTEKIVDEVACWFLNIFYLSCPFHLGQRPAWPVLWSMLFEPMPYRSRPEPLHLTSHKRPGFVTSTNETIDQQITLQTLPSSGEVESVQNGAAHPVYTQYRQLQLDPVPFAAPAPATASPSSPSSPNKQ